MCDYSFIYFLFFAGWNVIDCLKFVIIYFFLLFCRLEHAKMHARHKGHESMHAEMVLILIVTLIIAQLVLVQWKQRHPKSYNVSQLFSPHTN